MPARPGPGAAAALRVAGAGRGTGGTPASLPAALGLATTAGGAARAGTPGAGGTGGGGTPPGRANSPHGPPAAEVFGLSGALSPATGTTCGLPWAAPPSVPTGEDRPPRRP